MFLAFCWCADVQRASAESDIDRAKLFDAVVDKIEQRFFDEKRLKEIDWRARADAMRPAVLAAPTTNDAIRQINALLAELKTSHTGLFAPDDYFYAILLDVIRMSDNSDLIARRYWGGGPYYPGIGAFTRIVGDRHFIDAVMEGSPAERAGLHYGDEILAVDGTPYSPVAAFRGKVGTTVELAVRRHAGGESEQVAVEVVPLHPVKAFGEATVASARIIERNGKRIGYIHIWASAEGGSFATALKRLEPASIMAERMRQAGVNLTLQEGLERFKSRNIAVAPIKLSLEKPKPIDFLVVDIRGKVGGNIAVPNQMLEALDAQTYWGGYAWKDRSAMTSHGVGSRASYRGRAALLINGDTRSAAELMAYGFKRSGFGPVIGANTAGAVSSGATYAMPGDLLLYVAVAGGEVDGQSLEGVGVAPDVQVERPLPYANGADPVLETALDLLAALAPKE